MQEYAWDGHTQAQEVWFDAEMEKLKSLRDALPSFAAEASMSPSEKERWRWDMAAKLYPEYIKVDTASCAARRAIGHTKILMDKLERSELDEVVLEAPKDSNYCEVHPEVYTGGLNCVKCAEERFRVRLK